MKTLRDSDTTKLHIGCCGEACTEKLPSHSSGVDRMNSKVFPVKVHVSDAAEISGAFRGTREDLGAPPNVVVYNSKHTRLQGNL